MVLEKLFALTNKTPVGEKKKAEVREDPMLRAVSETKLYQKKLNTKELFEHREILAFGAENAEKCAYYGTMDAKKIVLVGEPSEEKRAEAILKEKIPGGKYLFLSEPKTDLPYPDHCFDNVFLDGVLTKEDDPRPLLAEAARLCRKDGLICLSFRPHLAPYGDGMEDLVSLPHAHLLFPEKVLISAYLAKYGKDPRACGKRLGTNNAGKTVLRARPKLSSAKLNSLCRELSLTKVSETRVPVGKAASLFAGIPGIGDLFTASYVAVFRASGTDAAQADE